MDANDIDWTINRAPLGNGVLGDIFWPTKTIVIDPRLPAVVQRCTLAHEIEHAKRGPLPTEPVLAAREELAVDRAAARRLIKIHDLGEALAESEDHAYVAHDEKGEAKLGDTVEIMETRKLSKTKNWRLVKILKRVE